ncbi:hypothetical protein C7418_3927 [Cupriavidus plantarum]|nr:hypothetical protein C7418_3927 [Cupriavidus plantarum]
MFIQNVRPKVVRVCAYTRVRFGRPEFVCSHWRSMPY